MGVRAQVLKEIITSSMGVQGSQDPVPHRKRSCCHTRKHLLVQEEEEEELFPHKKKILFLYWKNISKNNLFVYMRLHMSNMFVFTNE